MKPNKFSNEQLGSNPSLATKEKKNILLFLLVNLVALHDKHFGPWFLDAMLIHQPQLKTVVVVKTTRIDGVFIYSNFYIYPSNSYPESENDLNFSFPRSNAHITVV